MEKKVFFIFDSMKIFFQYFVKNKIRNRSVFISKYVPSWVLNSSFM